MSVMRRPNSITSSLITLVILCGALGAETAQISPEARSHLTEVISVLQREWLHRDTMDWERLRQRVFAKAGAAQTIPETYDRSWTLSTTWSSTA